MSYLERPGHITMEAQLRQLDAELPSDDQLAEMNPALRISACLLGMATVLAFNGELPTKSSEYVRRPLPQGQGAYYFGGVEHFPSTERDATVKSKLDFEIDTSQADWSPLLLARVTRAAHYDPDYDTGDFYVNGRTITSPNWRHPAVPVITDDIARGYRDTMLRLRDTVR